MPEAQIDRFMLKVIIEYPKKEEKIIMRNNLAKNFPTANAILKPKDILRARDLVKEIYMDEKLNNISLTYICN